MSTSASYGIRTFRGIGIGECQIDLSKTGLENKDFASVEATLHRFKKLTHVSIDPWSRKLHFTVKVDGVPSSKQATVIDETYLSVLGVVLHKVNPKKAPKLLKAAEKALAG